MVLIFRGSGLCLHATTLPHPVCAQQVDDAHGCPRASYECDSGKQAEFLPYGEHNWPERRREYATASNGKLTIRNFPAASVTSLSMPTSGGSGLLCREG